MTRKLDEKFIESINRLAGRRHGEVLASLIASLEKDEPSVAVRINPLKETGLPPGKRKVAWAPDGVYIDGERPRFTFDPAMHQGRYYVQDASSMVIETIVRELAGTDPIVYIDACAAPGGKTTAAISSLPAGSLMIANEYDRRRADALCENIIKWGYPYVVVTGDDTSKFAALGAIADIVAADVPCSGEGMMRKEAAAVEQWSPSLVRQCAELQRSIIDNMWKVLRPGGYFIYSTCTFNHTENEENLAYIAEKHGGIPVDMHLDCRFPQIAPAIDSPYPAARFIPGRTDGEGLFIAVMQKPGNRDAKAAPRPRKEKQQPARKREKSDKRHAGSIDGVARWIDSNGFETVTEGERLSALPVEWLATINDIKKALRVIYAGTEIAVLKGRDAIPSQALALSTIIDSGAFTNVEVDYNTALQYLSRQTVSLDNDVPKGFVLLRYDGHPLGFVKNLGNRANNLYPQGWAIKSTHLPDFPPDILNTPPIADDRK